MAVLTRINKQLSESGDFVATEGLAGPDQARLVRSETACQSLTASSLSPKSSSSAIGS
jgi:hypothetical protein